MLLSREQDASRHSNERRLAAFHDERAGGPICSGYTQPHQEEEIGRWPAKGYGVQEPIGRGLERVLRVHCVVEWGGQQLEVNAAGVQRVLADRQARSGRSHLT